MSQNFNKSPEAQHSNVAHILEMSEPKAPSLPPYVSVSPTTGGKSCNICGAYAAHGKDLVCKSNCPAEGWRWLYECGMVAGKHECADEVSFARQRIREFDKCIQKVAAELDAVCGGVDGDQADIHSTTSVLLRRIAELKAERNSMRGEINTPQIHDFIKAIKLEAVRQRQLLGTEHDESRLEGAWLWLVAYLATKATQAHRYDDGDKCLIITCAASCLNWHANAVGANTAMRSRPPSSTRRRAAS